MIAARPFWRGRASFAALRLALAAALLLPAAGAAGQVGRLLGLRIDPSAPTAFQGPGGAQILCFLPGNAGSAAFGEKSPQASPTRGTAAEEIRCNGQVVVLDDPDYTLRVPLGREPSPTAGLWRTALESLLADGADRKRTSDLRITNSFLDRLRKADAEAPARFARRLAALPDPERTTLVISFEAPSKANGKTAAALCEALRSALPRLLIGRVVEEFPGRREALKEWDFVIVRPELLPEGLRGQAAMDALFDRLGRIPIVLRLHSPHFYRDIVYLATGAAGFQYGSFPPRRGSDHDQRLRSLRAFGATLARLRGGTVRLMPELASPGSIGAFGIDGKIYSLILVRGGQATFRPPEVAGSPEFFGTWYRPATDELIVRPNNTAERTASGELLLTPPEPDGAWIYSHYLLPAGAP